MCSGTGRGGGLWGFAGSIVQEFRGLFFFFCGDPNINKKKIWGASLLCDLSNIK